MSVDIFAVQPHKVSKSLRGYTIMFYGAPKTGKTTTACSFEKPLLFAFEVGYLAIPGAMALPIQRWADFKQAIKQLKDGKAKEAYANCIVDTCDLAYSLCEKYICAKNGVQEIGEIPYGGGYKQVETEFDETLRQIPQMGYGLVLISHSQDKTFTDENGKEYNQIVPTLNNRGRLVVDRMSDCIIYVKPTEMEDGSIKTVGYFRGTPRYVAGSRFACITDHIVFTYDNLVKAISDAIDEEAKLHDNKLVTDEAENAYAEQPTKSFTEVKSEFTDIVNKLSKSMSREEFKTKWKPVIEGLTDKYLGTGKKVNDCTEQQVDQITLIVEDLKDKIAQGI